MKANVKSKGLLETVSTLLNEAGYLYKFDIEKLSNKVKLYVKTDDGEITFTSFRPDDMIQLLTNLKTMSPNFSEDIDDLIQELEE